MKMIYIFAEGYYLDVCFEGLIPYSRSSSITSVSQKAVFGYALNFGYTALNTLEKRCFTLKNNSNEYVYKFHFPIYSEVIFTPAVGHLKPGATKQIIAAFLSKFPINLIEV